MQDWKMPRWGGGLIVGLLAIGLCIGLFAMTPATKLLAAGNTIEVKGGSHVVFQTMPHDDHVVIDGSTVTFNDRAEPKPKGLANTTPKPQAKSNVVQTAYHEQRPQKPRNGQIVNNYYGTVHQYNGMTPEQLPGAAAGQQQMAQWKRQFGQ